MNPLLDIARIAIALCSSALQFITKQPPSVLLQPQVLK
jgi:hypothetical protein